MPSANTRHRATFGLVLCLAGLYFCSVRVVLCCFFVVLGVPRNEPRYDPAACNIRSRSDKKGVENRVFGGLGAPWGAPWGHFGPREAQGERRHRKGTKK